MFHGNIEDLTIDNKYYRNVIYTGKNMQLVLMTLKPADKIPKEIHKTHDQFIRIEEGSCQVVSNKNNISLKKNDFIIIPANTEHEVINSGDNELKLYTIYAPPEHQPGTVNENNPLQTGGNIFFEKFMNYRNKNNIIINMIEFHHKKTDF